MHIFNKNIYLPRHGVALHLVFVNILKRLDRDRGLSPSFFLESKSGSFLALLYAPNPSERSGRQMIQFCYFRSTIGQKAVMALTGILLFGFIVAHLIGNLQMFAGPDAINEYAKLLKSMPALLWTARVGLFVIFATHVATAFSLKRRNMNARPEGYAYEDTVQASLASRTMIATGTLLLLYIAYHLAHFTLGATHPEFFHLTDAKGRHDVYSMVVLSFQSPGLTLVYILAMGILALHLSHGIASFFQTMGWSSNKLRGVFEKGSKIIALLIFVGYCSIPAAVQLGIISLSHGGF